MQASKPLAITGKARDKPTLDENPGITSPGQQWLQYLGVADSRDTLYEPQPTAPPSAKAWLTRKSRQILGLPPRPQQALAHSSLPLDRRKADEAAAEVDASLQDELKQQLHIRNADGQGEDLPSLQTLSTVQQSSDSPAADSEQPTDLDIRDSDSLEAPQTVFSDNSEPHVLPESRKQPDRRRLQFKPQLSLKEHSRKGFQRSRGVPHSLSLPPSNHASEQDGSSNEDRAFARRGTINPRAELQDHGSVSLAYSEHDHSSDTEVTDGSAEPSLAKARSSTLTAAMSRHDSQDSRSEQQETRDQPSSSLISQHFEPCKSSEGDQMTATSQDQEPSIEDADRDSIARRNDKHPREADARAVPEGVKQGPVFVPIVMEMDEEDQAMLIEQHCLQLDVSFFKKESQSRLQLALVQQRNRA